MNQKKKELRKQEKALKQLQKDRKDCWNEITPILNKYTLIIRGQLRRFDDGIIAQAILDRKPPEETPPEQPVPAPVSASPGGGASGPGGKG